MIDVDKLTKVFVHVPPLREGNLIWKFEVRECNIKVSYVLGRISFWPKILFFSPLENSIQLAGRTLLQTPHLAM